MSTVIAEFTNGSAAYLPHKEIDGKRFTTCKRWRLRVRHEDAEETVSRLNGVLADPERQHCWPGVAYFRAASIN